MNPSLLVEVSHDEARPLLAGKQVRAAPPQKVCFLHCFSLKELSHFGMESGMVFEGTTGVNNKLTFKLQRTANEYAAERENID